MPFVENVVIAAAGMGTRLGAGKPKCLVEVCGKMIVEYQMELLKDIKNVYLVVGFCELDVIRVVKELRRDVIFVRNPDFQHTKTLESYHLAAKAIKGNAVFMDGDMIVAPRDFRHFIHETENKKFLLGVSERISDEPVYTKIQKADGYLIATGFSYSEESPYEWANIVYMPSKFMNGGNCNAFEHLQGMLPMPATVLDRLEIDTEKDLMYAECVLSSGDGRFT